MSEKLTEEYLRKRYIHDRASTVVIAAEKGTTAPNVRYWLAKYLIRLRTSKEAANIATQEGRKPGRRLEKVLCSEGYWMVRKPEHPHADCNGYTKEHVLVWEEAHGKPLPRDLIVHHISGIKTDNRPENLQAYSRSDHMKFHHAQRRSGV